MRDERLVDVHADRLEALTNIAYLMRHDMAHRDRMEMYLQLMDGVLAGMATDEFAESPSAASCTIRMFPQRRLL